jgi:hypothetical protein
MDTGHGGVIPFGERKIRAICGRKGLEKLYYL